MTDEHPSDEPRTTEALHPLGPVLRATGNYRLLQKIGEGGMGEVYLAEQDRPIRRRVALKIIKPGMDSREVAARFEAERQALALMDHPSIAKVFDAGVTEQGRCFFAMEHVQGIPITQYCDKHHLPARDRLQLFVQVCDGIQHAHQKAIIHRDLKPSNLLVAIQDGRPVPKIIDFGVAKATSHRLTDRTMFTELGQLIGTPEYMSPEQAEMTGENIDTRADVYSLGVVLYELLVGALPFEAAELRASGLEEIRRRIREDEPLRPSARLAALGEAAAPVARNRGTTVASWQSELRGDLDWITMKALEKDRTRRYGAVSELAADVQRHLRHETVLACPPSARYRVGKFVRRHRVGVSVAIGLLGVLVAFAATMAVQARRIARERDRANREAETARAVSSFLVELFQVSDPDAARGGKVTAGELLDAGARRIETELAEEPLTQARLMEVMGRAYQSVALFDRARPLHERALEIRRGALGSSHPDVAESMNSLANLHRGQASFEQAEPLFRQALAMYEAELGPEHPKVAQCLQDLAAMHLDRTRLEEAVALLLRATDILRGAHGPDDPRVAASLRLLGIAYIGSADYENAERLYKESLSIYERAGVSDRPEVARVLANLSNLYWMLGRLDEARPLLERTLAIREKIYGPDHLFVAYSLEDMGMIDQDQGRFAEAVSLCERSLAIKERTLGPDHPRVAMALGNLGSVLNEMGEYKRARPLLERSFAIMERTYGRDDPNVSEALQLLAEMWRRTGESRKARALLERALAIQEKNYGPKNISLARTCHNLGAALRDLGEYAEAETLLARALSIREAVLAKNSRYLAETVEEYARLLRLTGRASTAGTMESRARTIRMASRPR